MLQKLSLIPDGYKTKDPRALLYHFPSLPKVKYAKLVDKFYYYKALEAVENVANKMGYILLPRICMHWQRKKNYADRKIVVLGKSFYMMKIAELTETEKSKLLEYIEENVSPVAS